MEPLRHGDRITFYRDSIVIGNLGYDDGLTIPRYDSLAGGDTLDVAATWNLLEPDLVNVDLYNRGRVYRNRYFTPVDTAFKALDPLELASATYRYHPSGMESTLLYFGNSKMPDDRLLPGPYYVEWPSAWNAPTTLIRPGNINYIRNADFGPQPLAGFMSTIFLGSRPLTFVTTSQRLLRSPAGDPIVERYAERNKQFIVEQVLLDRVGPTVPPTVTTSQLAERLNSGTVYMHTDYPEADSADIRYTFEERIDEPIRAKILERDELDELAFSFNPDGEFIFMGGDKAYHVGRWMLSEDRNWLMVDPAELYRTIHIPIIKYTDEVIAFRYPMSVRTRRPRGRELPSFVALNAYLEIRTE